MLYCTIDMENAIVGRTSIITNEINNSFWNESFHVYCACNVANLIISIKDDDPVDSSMLGMTKILITNILSSDSKIDEWYDLVHKDGKN